MKYLKIHFTCNPNTEVVTEVLTYEIAGIGFESFVNSPDGMDAYIPKHLFSAEELDHLLLTFYIDAKIDYTVEEQEDKNWNEEWERNYFQPIVIDDRCIIHSSFHRPEGEYEYRILIDPKMAFGTGHHQTTGLILHEILCMDVKNKSVLDMGCGTAVLAILARMRGAHTVLGIDNDEWAYNNAKENVQLNDTSDIRVQLGGSELLGNETFDVIFANINRNILLRDIPSYSEVLNPDGTIILSGFYTDDVHTIQSKCEECGLSFSHTTEKDNWAAVTCTK